MCAKCDKAREECEAEIRDLLNYHRKVNGPLSQSMKERLAKVADDVDASPLPEDSHERRMLIDAIRMEMIAERCALYARSCPTTYFHTAPPSIIMQAWAQELRQQELSILAEALSGILPSGIMGIMLMDENDEDEE